MPRVTWVRVRAPLIPEVAFVEFPPSMVSAYYILMAEGSKKKYQRRDFYRERGHCLQLGEPNGLRLIRTNRRQLACHVSIFPHKDKKIHTNNDFSHTCRNVFTITKRRSTNSKSGFLVQREGVEGGNGGMEVLRRIEESGKICGVVTLAGWD